MTVLADAALDDREREVLEHFVDAIVREYGADLDALWLYGSRARGERAHDESDIDVLVVTRNPRDDDALYAILHRVLNELGNPRVLLEPRQRSRAWVEDRRAIESFFIHDVDHDKIVLYRPSVNPRSAEFLSRARRGLASAQLVLDAGHAETTVSTAYYAMLNAAHAALSERDMHARSHTGVWNLFRGQFVLSGEFDDALWRAAQRTQARREASDYGAAVLELEEAAELMTTARRFVDAVEHMTG